MENAAQRIAQRCETILGNGVFVASPGANQLLHYVPAGEAGHAGHCNGAVFG